jgi:dTDP-4-amino-4,6-dideoxygalactose transaminase
VDYDRGDCPHAEKACEQVFSLPVFPATSSDDLVYIAWAIKESIAALK